MIDGNQGSDFANKKVVIRTHQGKNKKFRKTASLFKLTRNIVISGIPLGSNVIDFIGTDNRGGREFL